MAIYGILLQLFEKAVMNFYIDIENYKLHWISIHNHYIYTQTSSKKNHTGLEFTCGNLTRCRGPLPCSGARFRLPAGKEPVKRTRSNPCAARAFLDWPAWYGLGLLNTQTAQKCSLVMLVNKVNFGEWVKRQRNYQNKTKNENKNEKQNNSNHKPCTLQIV